MSIIPCFVILLSIVVIVGANMVCPGENSFWPSPRSCVNQCSSDKDNCETGKKCCYTSISPCGFRCVLPKNNKTKRGKCPPALSAQKDDNWILCDAHLCDVDSDCRRRKKCCQNMCGSNMCIRPQ